MQLINKNLNDIYFYFNNFDVVCGSASEVSRYFPLITAQRQELALLPCFNVMKYKVRNFQEVSVNVNEKQSEEKEINNVHHRQQRPKNNVKHEMLANIIHQKMK
ncbi:Uncharacterised protein [Salmonella enterica subsp. diarizonae]|nr:Uncharacterised protein [Salmonella enterica subsp. diarizonae]